MNEPWGRIGAVLLLALSACSCASREAAMRPKLTEDVERLMGDIDVLPPFPEPLPASGSLWTDGGPGAALTRDLRAFRVNDLVRIELRERSAGSNEATTELSRKSENDVGAGIAFGLEDPNPQSGSFNLNNVLRSSASTEFAGDGATSRGNQLNATITSRVMRVLPNGDLVVAGQKTVVVNRERQVLTLVGSVRAVDVDARNAVPSSSVGDLTVRLWGQGEVDGTVRQGWFMRVLNRVWPF